MADEGGAPCEVQTRLVGAHDKRFWRNGHGTTVGSAVG